MMRPRQAPHRLLLVVGALAVVVAACTPDSDDAEDDSTPDQGTEATEPTTTGSDPASDRHIAEDCPPAAADQIAVAPAWPGPELRVSTDGPPLEIDLAEAIEADCIVLGTTWSAALPAPTPSLGTIGPTDGLVLRYHPPDPPSDPDDPQAPWWGQDRIRACVPVEGGRLTCVNIDIEVLRPDVVALADGFGGDTLPATLSSLERAGPLEGGLSHAGVARLQDALAAEWALGLISAAIDRSDDPPATLSEACEAEGVELEAMWDRGRAVLDVHAELSDLRSLELIAATGQEPDPDLSAQANEVLAKANDWLACRQ